MVHPALDTLLRAMEDDSEKVRASAVTAARDVLDRAGYGAAQKIEVENVSKEEFESDLKAYLLGRHDQFGESQESVDR